ncbi:MAG TPA: metalloregulator ArsR/SmtB family transcription factor [Devosiaceae bacterium]|nr:metalloregulator ArsR/SmtB family transcription factor [Devosiaceae bacterium]
MSKQQRHRYGLLFTALSDPIRLAIIDRLSREGEMSVGALGAPFAITAPAISRHLKVLEHAELIERRVDRQWRICSLRHDTLTEACAWLHEVTRQAPPR